MSFETMGRIGQLLFLVVLALSFRPWEGRSLETVVSSRCKEENALIDHWKSMNLIRYEKQNGKNRDFFVYDRAWAALPRSTQMDIGNAAYCDVERVGKGGVARIDDLGGKELARVADGKWLSWKFPE